MTTSAANPPPVLLPCPCCGTVGELRPGRLLRPLAHPDCDAVLGGRPLSWRATCTGPACGLSLVRATPAAAALAWNRRPAAFPALPGSDEGPTDAQGSGPAGALIAPGGQDCGPGVRPEISPALVDQARPATEKTDQP